MSIQELSVKFKGFFSDQDTLLAGLIIVVGVASFVLGRASVHEGIPNKTQSETIAETTIVSTTSEATVVIPQPREQVSPSKQVTQMGQGGYVASKTGTKYYLPWCGGVKRIKEENKVYFGTKDDAEKAGYSPAANCKGI